MNKLAEKLLEDDADGLHIQHYKGGVYKILMLATDEKTGERVMVYRSMSDGPVWTRTLVSTLETVCARGVPRFTLYSKDV